MSAKYACVLAALLLAPPFEAYAQNGNVRIEVRNEGAPVARALRPALVDTAAGPTPFPTAGFLTPSGDPEHEGCAPDAGDPGSDAVSPILVGKREARGLAYFIYMALEARETHDLQPFDIGLEPGGEELVFVPAVWDPRCIHESNWRLLLNEFDGLVA